MSDTRGTDGDMGPDDLDLYIDGRLDDARRAAFERRLFADPELAAELERQRSLDARLAAAFPVPEDPAAIARQALTRDRPRDAGRHRFRSLRVAAAAVLLVAAGLWAVGVFDAGDGRGAPVRRIEPLGPGLPAGDQSCVSFGGLYAELAEDRRLGAAACRLPHDLPRHFQDALGQPLVVDATDEIPIEGPFPVRRWPTATLLASPQQPEPILIVVDVLARDPQPVLEAGSPAHLFRRELGDLVLYELTPRDTSRALELFRLP